MPGHGCRYAASQKGRGYKPPPTAEEVQCLSKSASQEKGTAFYVGSHSKYNANLSLCNEI